MSPDWTWDVRLSGNNFTVDFEKPERLFTAYARFLGNDENSILSFSFYIYEEIKIIKVVILFYIYFFFFAGVLNSLGTGAPANRSSKLGSSSRTPNKPNDGTGLPPRIGVVLEREPQSALPNIAVLGTIELETGEKKGTTREAAGESRGE